jgi:hypothetical protein
MVGRGDKDSVELLLENLVIIEVGGRDAVRALLYGVATGPIDVTHGDDLVVANLVGGA